MAGRPLTVCETSVIETRKFITPREHNTRCSNIKTRARGAQSTKIEREQCQQFFCYLCFILMTSASGNLPTTRKVSITGAEGGTDLILNANDSLAKLLRHFHFVFLILTCCARRLKTLLGKLNIVIPRVPCVSNTSLIDGVEEIAHAITRFMYR